MLAKCCCRLLAELFSKTLQLIYPKAANFLPATAKCAGLPEIAKSADSPTLLLVQFLTPHFNFELEAVQFDYSRYQFNSRVFKQFYKTIRVTNPCPVNPAPAD